MFGASFCRASSSLCTMRTQVQYPAMAVSPIKFGTSGWRGLIADDFTFATVRLAVTAIADHINAKTKNPTVLVGYDTRFYSEEFSQLAVEILQQHKIKALLCDRGSGRERLAQEGLDFVLLQNFHRELREFFRVETRIVADQHRGIFSLGVNVVRDGGHRQANGSEREIVRDQTAPARGAKLDGRDGHGRVLYLGAHRT